MRDSAFVIFHLRINVIVSLPRPFFQPIGTICVAAEFIRRERFVIPVARS